MDNRSGPYQSNGFQANGLLPKESTSVFRPIDPEQWVKAEEQVAQLISCIQPNWSSEKHRHAVALYVEGLITNCIPCQVFPFGSVPLKTYLPDGDIDLTVFSEDQNLKDGWAYKVRDMLEREEKNEHAEFQVKEVKYIQAEVKIIKCLVDNIVVDISFNQLGGLCTLCFLEEVDNLINQNHLFKRSVILIKAWCYYESRILGAHHALISTYALETLVLYTFHVFNNSFAGPLEVLYHFLEFFSKFDWANFCVSLWGPVPIGSLPNMAADPPRKDSRELLLSKMFLSACSTAYAVFPGGQDTQEQPFITKHLNIIDPLRFNNNLGRSVNKGNFYRIRSAFSFGAQQLARILERQEKNILVEVNRFFVNTWDRHGKGCRPDASIVDASCLRQVESKAGGNHRKHSSSKNPPTENIACAPEFDQSHSLLDSSVQPIILPMNLVARSADALKDVVAHKQQNYNDSTGQDASRWDHQYTQGLDLTRNSQDDREENFMMKILPNKGRTRHQFARTYSSPELTNMSSDASSHHMHNVVKEVEKDTSSMSNHSRWPRGSCIVENHMIRHTADRASTRESPKSQDVTSKLSHSLVMHVGNSVTGSMPTICSPGDDSSQTHHKEQEITNLVPPPAVRTHGGHLHMPVTLSSHQLVQIPPSVLGYNHQMIAGTVSAYSIESDWGNTMHRSYGPPFPHNVHTVEVTPDQADSMGRLNGSVVSAEAGHQDDGCGFWTDSNVESCKEIDSACENFPTANSRLSPPSPATSSRTKESSEACWNGKPSKKTTVVNYHLGTKIHAPLNAISSDNIGWQDDGEFVDQSCSDVDDDHKDWVSFSTTESVTSSVTSSQDEIQRLSGFGPVHMSYPTSVLPFAPVLVRPGSQQGMTHNHGMVAFYPAGPPVPFVTMMPLYSIPAEAGTSSALYKQHDIETLKPNFPVPQSGCSLDSTEDPEQLSSTDNCHSVEKATSGEHPGEDGSDIFNSDFPSHWKNLQYGRFCQISQMQHQFVYSPSVVVSPQHSSGSSPFNVPKKPSPRNANSFAHVAPVSAQRGSSKYAGVSRRHAGDVSKNRNGTGTYFPNPKTLRDRQFSTSRQYRGDYNNDRNEHHGDREANCNFSKPRSGGRGQARHYYEKSHTKIDQSAVGALQIDRQWDTFQHKSSRSFHSTNEHFVGKNGHERSGYWRRGDHQLQNYCGDSGTSSPQYISPPRFPGAT